MEHLSGIKEQMYYISTNNSVCDAIVNYFYEKSDDWEINETKKIFLDTFSLLGNLSRY